MMLNKAGLPVRLDRSAASRVREAWAGALGLALVVAVVTPGGATAVTPRPVSPELTAGAPEFFQVCDDQT